MSCAVSSDSEQDGALFSGVVQRLGDGAFSPVFHAWGALAIALAWVAALAGAVFIVLRHAVGTRNHHDHGRERTDLKSV